MWVGKGWEGQACRQAKGEGKAQKQEGTKMHTMGGAWQWGRVTGRESTTNRWEGGGGEGGVGGGGEWVVGGEPAMFR